MGCKSVISDLGVRGRGIAVRLKLALFKYWVPVQVQLHSDTVSKNKSKPINQTKSKVKVSVSVPLRGSCEMGLFKGNNGCKLGYLLLIMSWHTYIVRLCMCVSLCVCANMCRPEVSIRCISQDLDTLIFETGPLYGTWGQQMNLGWLASKSPESPACLSVCLHHPSARIPWLFACVLGTEVRASHVVSGTLSAEPMRLMFCSWSHTGSLMLFTSPSEWWGSTF